MCGILGSYNIENIEGTVKNLSLRGRDGFGYYDNNKDKIIKSVDNVKHFKDSLNRGLYIFNSRALPTTEWETGAGHSIENQQPFSNEQYVIVHNGIISNDKELIKKYNLDVPSKVDSAILPSLFKTIVVVEGMKQLKGSYAILCFDKQNNKLYAGKNFMPLRMFFGNNKFLFASTKQMVSNLDTKNVDPYKCLELDILDNKVTIKEHSLYPSKQNKRVLVILSGGIDSTTTAFLYKHLGYDVNVIHFTYGQAAQECELFAVKKLSQILGCEPIIFDANEIFKPFNKVSLLLKNKMAVKGTQMLDAESTLSYVPNRNAIFANIAAGVAEMLRCDTVSFGGQQMDSVYPDNNPDFVDSINESFKYSLNWYSNIRFTSPLIHLIKHEIVELGTKLEVPYEYICSCYYPTLKNDKIIHCKECGCCQFKHTAFEMIKEREVINDVDKFIESYINE